VTAGEPQETNNPVARYVAEGGGQCSVVFILEAIQHLSLPIYNDAPRRICSRPTPPKLVRQTPIPGKARLPLGPSGWERRQRVLGGLSPLQNSLDRHVIICSVFSASEVAFLRHRNAAAGDKVPCSRVWTLISKG
jgi:hypothetical protein